MFRQLYRNMNSACLCWVGWFEVYGMMESVKVVPIFQTTWYYIWNTVISFHFHVYRNVHGKIHIRYNFRDFRSVISIDCTFCVKNSLNV